ncbi:hypothetical protein J2W30_006390 [Variovorax boronicumulans]|uniref:hypothetical protein n=1 Tax=Variovorax boronicumulans TaxID=436515 RepID=UPI00277DF964|nr:hypothetical protein [Variovorax boronicumulans]MDQ0038603.1 hypothetical protein [Variovorax boronicumulans]
MLKSAKTYVVFCAIVAVTGIGMYYYINHATIESSPPSGKAVPPVAAPSAPQDGDVERKILQSIGSIKDLKHVPLQPDPVDR